VSRAIACDVCGELCEVAGTVTLAVRKNLIGERSSEWSEVDVCPACLERPLRDVLAEGCLEFFAQDVPEDTSPT
jgi:hypothetical protein